LVLVWVLALAQAVYFYLTYMAGHDNFLNGAVDLATISQSLWNITQGHTPFETILGTHALRVHFSPIWYLVAQVFRIWPTIPWLVFLSTFSVALSSLIVFALGRAVLKSDWLALAMAVSYLLNPYLHLGQMAAVHAESFDICFIGLSLLALWRRRFAWFWICMLVALSGKEDVGLYYGALGIYAFFGMKERLQGVLMSVAGLLWSFAVLHYVMPAFGPDTQNLISRFSELGQGGNGDFVKNLFTHPWRIVTPILQWEKIFTLFYLIAQTAFSVFWAGWALVPLGAAIWLKSITNYVGMYNFWDHYSLHVLPFLAFASILGMQAWLEHPRWQKWRVQLGGNQVPVATALALFILILSLFINLERGDNPLSRKFHASVYTVSAHNQLGQRLLRQIPGDASLLAQEHIAAHVSLRQRIWAVSADYAWKPGEQPLCYPEYAVFDLQAARHLIYYAKVQDTAQWFYADSRYEVQIQEDGWVIFKRRHSRPGVRPVI
jgi:uncharacterized membrane protein